MGLWPQICQRINTTFSTGKIYDICPQFMSSVNFSGRHWPSTPLHCRSSLKQEDTLSLSPGLSPGEIRFQLINI